MAVKLYLLIEIKVGKTREVVNAIRGLAGVVFVDAVTGPYDAIATMEAETLNDIGDLVTTKIHAISGISRIVSCIAVETS